MVFYIFNVYGPTKTKEKYLVWGEISGRLMMLDSFKTNLGDNFNAIIKLLEKSGGLRSESVTLIDFREFVDKNNICDHPPKEWVVYADQ